VKETAQDFSCNFANFTSQFNDDFSLFSTVFCTNWQQKIETIDKK